MWVGNARFDSDVEDWIADAFSTVALGAFDRNDILTIRHDADVGAS